MEKRLNYKDNFEMLLFRHDYLKRVEKYDPIWLSDYSKIIQITSKKMFYKYKESLDIVGLDKDDVFSLTQLFTIYYMSLYSVNRDEESTSKFQAKFINKEEREPTSQDHLVANKGNLISFIRQRFQRVNSLCKKKGVNIYCDRTINAAYAKTARSKPASSVDLVSNWKKLGYRKVSNEEMEEIVKNKGEYGQLKDSDGFNIVKVSKKLNQDNIQDWRFLIDNIHTDYRQSPSDIVDRHISEVETSSYKGRFDAMPSFDKVHVLNRFIKENKGNRRMKVEVAEAKLKLSLLQDIE